MIRKVRTLLVLVAAVLASGQYVAALDNLYVVQFGDGAAPVSATSALVTIQKYTTAAAQAAPVSSIFMPVADAGATHALTGRGNSTTEGYMSLSTDGKYLDLIGYNTAPGVASPQTAAGVNRVVGQVTLSSGAIDTTTVLTDGSYAGSSPRGATSTNGTDIWTGGDSSTVGNGGARYVTLGSSSETPISGPNNGRSIHIFNDATNQPQLYLASMSGAQRGVNQVGTGTPMTGVASTLLPGFDPSTSSAESVTDFWFKDANTLYVADSRTGGAAAGGGIQRWNLSGGTWTLAYSLEAGLSAAATPLGLTGTVVGGQTVLYATNFSFQLVSITDAGAGSPATVLATAPTNTVFRGLAFVPGVGLAGDYNGDGKVDAADYVTWRKNPGANGGDPAGYITWRNNFGLPGAGSGLSAGAVPEPTSVVLLLVGMLVTGWRQRRSG